MIDFPVLLELVTYAVATFTLDLEENESFLSIIIVVIALQYTPSPSSAYSPYRTLQQRILFSTYRMHSLLSQLRKPPATIYLLVLYSLEEILMLFAFFAFVFGY
jgi:hypothetical protein